VCVFSLLQVFVSIRGAVVVSLASERNGMQKFSSFLMKCLLCTTVANPAASNVLNLLFLIRIVSGFLRGDVHVPIFMTPLDHAGVPVHIHITFPYISAAANESVRLCVIYFAKTSGRTKE
jgi:hypothetical protein